MSEKPLSYPRLFSTELDKLQTIESNLEPFTELASGFAALTGWKLSYRETAESKVRREGVGCRNLPIQARIAIDDLADDAITGAVRASQRDRCERVIDGINAILRELDRCREDIWRKNAELAAGIPVTDDGSAAEKLALLLNSLLTSAVDAAGAKRAALYLLDDGTQNLNLRTKVGFPARCELATSRDLSRAKADLEALLGHAVVIEDSSRFTSWDIPAECGSALCLPISSATNLLGTFWLFDEEARQFGGPDVNVVEIIAGRIAAELERFALLQIARRLKDSSGQTTGVETNARPQLPNIHPPIDELSIEGSISLPRSARTSGAVYDWAICQRGRLAVLVARADGAESAAARVATILQTAFRAHSAHCATALQLFDCVFETAMSVGSGECPVQFTCGYVDPQSGRSEFASTEQRAGSLTVVDNEFQVQLDAGSDAIGEFGLAHLSRIVLHAGDELSLTICDAVSSELGFTDFDPTDFSFVTASPPIATVESAAVATLSIRRRS